MARGFTDEYIAELEKTANTPIRLVALQLQSETIYLTTAHRNVYYDGHTYLSAGYLLAIGEIEENSALQVSTLTMSLSGVDQSIVSAFLQHQFHNRDLVVYKAFLGSEDKLIFGGKIFGGKITQAGITDDPEKGTTVIAVNASNHWADFGRRAGRRTNHNDQQLHFPNDMGLQFADRTLEQLGWGRAND
jgi:hypothetical protein